MFLFQFFLFFFFWPFGDKLPVGGKVEQEI